MIDDYAETRVVIAPSGELVLALPVYANQNGSLFNEKEIKSLTGLNVSIGCYEKIGYVMYHPSQELSFYMNSLDLFTDLGNL
jgi:hypothetical protein